MPFDIKLAGLSDIGRMREKNEDALYFDREMGLMIISDGLGGHRAGDVASRIVVEELARQMAMGHVAGMDNKQEAAMNLLRQSILIIGELINDMACDNPNYHDMGATVVAGLITTDVLIVAHLGDSRAYRLRNGNLELLTQDHNVGQMLRDKGVIKKDACDSIPEYHVLQRFVGMKKRVAPGMATANIKSGDRFLLCSDGLTNMLDDAMISEILTQETTPELTCSKLVEHANNLGGYDNITVIIADFYNEDENDKELPKPLDAMAIQMDKDSFPQKRCEQKFDEM
jgi:serine/threonine protein phosphatase PrpC